ncbi:MAG: hypothetical protein FWH44_00105 [Methanomassiliicoccaceae archaeon]|nr:hypothetical protein [Methanomassiliicoccaceae archaeon]
MSIFTFMEKRKETKGPEMRYDEGMLFVDCRPCGGASSLGDADCVKCVSKGIARHGPPGRLLMRKESDVEYSDAVISVLSDISKVFSLMDTASSEKTAARCKGCPCSLQKNAKDIWDSFPEPRFDIMRLETERSDPGKEGCEECMWRTIGFIDRAEVMITDIRRKCAKTAFRLTEV